MLLGRFSTTNSSLIPWPSFHLNFYLCRYIFSVLAKGLNDGGRGINIAIVDPKTKDVTKVGHFDTYAEGTFTR